MCTNRKGDCQCGSQDDAESNQFRCTSSSPEWLCRETINGYRFARASVSLQKPLGLDFLPNLLGGLGIHPFHLLVHFIRRLPQLTRDEIEQMEGMNPKPPEQIRQEIEAERFLQGN